MGLKELLKDFKAHSIFLVAASPEKYAETSREIVRIMSKSSQGIYVTVNKPFGALKESLAKSHIDLGRLFFIDMAAKPFGGIKKGSNCLYLGDPKDLTSVSIAIDQAISSTKTDKFVFFDTVNTLLNYNNESIVIRFIHSLTGKMHNLGTKGIFLSVGRSDERIISQLAQFCDGCIIVN